MTVHTFGKAVKRAACLALGAPLAALTCLAADGGSNADWAAMMPGLSRWHSVPTGFYDII